MELIVPFARMEAAILPFYPKGERGRPPIGLSRMLRMYLLQPWFGYADEAMECYRRPKTEPLHEVMPIQN